MSVGFACIISSPFSKPKPKIDAFEVSRFRCDEFIKFDEFVNKLLVVQILQVVFIVND